MKDEGRKNLFDRETLKMRERMREQKRDGENVEEKDNEIMCRRETDNICLSKKETGRMYV